MRISVLLLITCFSFILLVPTSEAAKPSWSIGTVMDYTYSNQNQWPDRHGVLLHYTTQSNWGFGYEEISIVHYDSTIFAWEGADITMLDLHYLFELPLINITLGAGLGNISPTQNLAFTNYQDSSAQQVYIQIGFSFGQLDFHLSSHQIEATVTDGTAIKDFSGEMMALGFSAKF